MVSEYFMSADGPRIGRPEEWVGDIRRIPEGFLGRGSHLTGCRCKDCNPKGLEPTFTSPTGDNFYGVQVKVDESLADNEWRLESSRGVVRNYGPKEPPPEPESQKISIGSVMGPNGRIGSDAANPNYTDTTPTAKDEVLPEDQKFSTGAVRDTACDKPCFELISPFALERLAKHLTMGANRYQRRNWEKGIPFDRTMASVLRHIMAYQQGKTDEDHLAASFCNLHFLLHYEEMIKLGLLPEDLDDMPKPLKKHE